MSQQLPTWRLKSLFVATTLAISHAAYAGGVPIVTATVTHMADGRDQVDMKIIDPDVHGTPYGPTSFSVYMYAKGRATGREISNYDGLAHYAASPTSESSAAFCSVEWLFYSWGSGCTKNGSLSFFTAEDTYDIYVYAQNGVGKSSLIKVGEYSLEKNPRLLSAPIFTSNKINIATFPQSGALSGLFTFKPNYDGVDIGVYEITPPVTYPWTDVYTLMAESVVGAGVGSVNLQWPIGRSSGNFVKKYDIRTATGSGMLGWSPSRLADIGSTGEILFDLVAPSLVSNSFDTSSSFYSIIANDSTVGVSGRPEWGLASIGIHLKQITNGTETDISKTSLMTDPQGYKAILDLSNLADGYYLADAKIVDKFGNSATPSIESHLEVANKVVTLTRSGSPFASGAVTNLSTLAVNLSEVADAATLSLTLKGGPENVNLPIATTPSAQGLVLQHPFIIPSGSGNDYSLIANIKTKNGVSKTYTFPIQYAPVTVGVDPLLGVSAVLVPAVAAPVQTSKGIPAFSTETLNLTGTADVKVRWSGALPIVIDGQTVAPGGSITFSSYDFSATGGKFRASIAPTKDGDMLTGKLLVMTNNGNASIMSANVIGLAKPSITLQPDAGMPSSQFYVLSGNNRVAFNVVPNGNTQAGLIRVDVKDAAAAQLANALVASGTGTQVKVNGSGLYSTHAVTVDVSYELFPGYVQSKATSYTVLGEFGDLSVNPVTTTSAAPSTQITGSISVHGAPAGTFDPQILGRQAARFVVKDAHNSTVAVADMGEVTASSLADQINQIQPGVYTVYLETELLDVNGLPTNIKKASSSASLNAAGAVGLDASISEGKVLLPVMPTAAKHSSGNWPLTSAVLRDAALNPAVGVADLDVTVDIGSGSVTIGGQTVTGKSNFKIMGYDFTANNGKVSLPITANNEFSGRIQIFPQGLQIPGVDVAISGIDVTRSVSLNTDQASYAANVEQVKVTAKATGLLCTSKMNVIANGNAAGNGCAINLASIPAGLTFQNGAITGFGTATGTQAISYDIGWVQQGTFIPIATGKTISVDFVDPVAPVVDFVPTASPLNGTQLLAKADGNPIGSGSAKTTYQTAETVVEVTADTGDLARGVGMGKTAAQAGIKLNPLTKLGVVQITVKGYYKRAPSVSTEKTYTAIIIGKFPSIAIDTNTPIANTNNVQIVGNYGFKDNLGVYNFDPSTMGNHRLTATLTDRLGKTLATVAPMLPQNANLTLPLGDLIPGEFILKIKDELLDTAGTTVLTSLQSSYTIKVVNGAAIDATLNSMTGQVVSVPSTAILSAVLKEKARVGEIGQTEWVESLDGVTYTPITDPAAVKQLTSLKTMIQSTGKRYFKAKIKNKYSGAVLETTPIEVEGLVKPKPKIASQAYVLTGTPVTLSVSDEANQTSNFVWYVIDGKEMKRYEGASITVTPSSSSNLAFLVKAILPGANESDTQRTTSAYGLTRVVGYIFEPFLYTVAGYTQPPRLLEAGKPYTFSMRRPKLMGVADMTNYPLDTKWMLSNGQSTVGDDITFTPKAGDYKVSYQASLVNNSKVSAMVNHYFSTYTYNWPDFTLTPQVQSNTAPTVVYMQVKSKDPAMTTVFKQEMPSYTWNLPDGMIKVQGKDDVLVAQINQGGTFTPSVTVSDKRGNSTVLSTQPLTIERATLLDTQVTAQIQDPWKRAPTKVFVNVSVKQIGKGDKVDRYDVYLDESLVVTTKALPISFTANQPFTGTLKVVTTSLGGATDTKVFPVEFIAPASPVCGISSQGTRSTFILLQAQCTVENGKIASYKWLANGVQVGTGSAYNIPSTVLRSGNIPTYQVVAETDLHTTGTASITP